MTIRRLLPDGEGNLVTYVTMIECSRIIGVDHTTISQWSRAGAIRSLGKFQNCVHVALVDAAKLRLMSPAESQALGIRRTPADELKRTAIWFEGKQQKTIPPADQRFEHWDGKDLEYVAWAVREGGKSIEEIALTLERSYAGVAAAIARLRESGDLPALETTDDGWLARTMHLVTVEEARVLVDLSLAA